jgi:hypothetical protein
MSAIIMHLMIWLHIHWTNLFVSEIKLLLFNLNLHNIDFYIYLGEKTQVVLKSSHVPLSRSVGVTMPKKLQDPSHQIEIVHDLEPNYKPRYKSDYFSQDGTVRQPRYVADTLGNHVVQIKVILSIHYFLLIYHLYL